MSNRELHFLNGGNAAHRFINRVIRPLIGKFVHLVQLFRCQRCHGRILNQYLIPMPLDHPFSPDLILLILLLAAGNRILPFGLAHLLKAGTFRRRAGLIVPDGNTVTGTADIPHRGNGFPTPEPVCNFNGLLFPHAKRQQIRLTLQQYGRADLVIPVIIVSKPPQRGFQTADHNGDIRIKTAQRL